MTNPTVLSRLATEARDAEEARRTHDAKPNTGERDEWGYDARDEDRNWCTFYGCPRATNSLAGAPVPAVDRSRSYPNAVEALTPSAAPLGEPPIESRGTFACPICGNAVPHHHDEQTKHDWATRPWLVRAKVAAFDDLVFEEEMRDRWMNHDSFVGRLMQVMHVPPHVELGKRDGVYTNMTFAALYDTWRTAVLHAIGVVVEHAPELESSRSALVEELRDARIRVAELETLCAAHVVTIGALNARLPEFARLHTANRALTEEVRRLRKLIEEHNFALAEWDEKRVTETEHALRSAFSE